MAHDRTACFRLLGHVYDDDTNFNPDKVTENSQTSNVVDLLSSPFVLPASIANIFTDLVTTCGGNRHQFQLSILCVIFFRKQ